ATQEGILVSFIDIGRHNALDKLYGYILKNHIPLKDTCVLFSGRISSEVVLKISKIGIGVLLAKSAHTDFVLKIADDLQFYSFGFVLYYNLNILTYFYKFISYIIQ